jgi:hypothetical protein
MPLDCIVIRAVAVSGRLNILQHLITEWNCKICTGLSHDAVRSGSISMLDWLRHKTSGTKVKNGTLAQELPEQVI